MPPVDPRQEPTTPTQPSMPESKKTTQLPAVPDWAIELTRSVKDGFAKMNANIEIVSNDLGVVKDRVTILESFKNDADARANRASAGVKSLSTTNAEQDAQLAQERMAREALAAKVDSLTVTQETQLAILSRLDKVASNPIVKTVLTILGTAFATWAASKGLK